jgi:hypothetical protein
MKAVKSKHRKSIGYALFDKSGLPQHWKNVTLVDSAPPVGGALSRSKQGAE